MFKKDITPLSKGGQITKHAGKGSAVAGMPDRQQINQLAKPAGQNINNYAKASPMPQPAPATDGIGSGNWPGIGE
jgi:hypothetical protein